jgi:hypothetical protein
MARWALRPPAPTAISRITFSTSCRAEPPASFQLPKAAETPISAAAGIVVTEMNTPMSAPAHRLGQGHHAHDPGQDRDHHREPIRAVDEVGDGPHAMQEQLRCLARGPDGHAEGERQHDRGGEARHQGQQAVTRGAAVCFADAERYGDDRAVLGADHHRADDEDLRVGQDAHRTDQPGDGQQDVEAGRIHRSAADGGFHHFPYRRNLPAG